MDNNMKGGAPNCCIAWLHVGSGDSAHGALPRLGVPGSRRQPGMHPGIKSFIQFD